MCSLVRQIVSHPANKGFLSERGILSNNLTLVLGGASSGKSKLAELLAERAGNQLVYVATAAAGDAEMHQKIRLHRERRGEKWLTVEESHDVAAVLLEQLDCDAILVDCLTMWVFNLMNSKTCLHTAATELFRAARLCKPVVILVSGETGLGIVPDNELSRRFSNELGKVNQLAAEQAQLVLFAIAGLPLVLKGQKLEWL